MDKSVRFSSCGVLLFLLGFSRGLRGALLRVGGYGAKLSPSEIVEFLLLA